MPLDELVVELLPPEEHYEHGQGYEVTCEICFFRKADCEKLKVLMDMCGNSDRGYFKQKPS